MPGLVNYSAQDELYHGRFFQSKTMDSNYSFPIASYTGRYCHPHKKPRFSSNVSLFKLCRNEQAELELKSPIESLPDECLFEILRRLNVCERTTCARVSKHWLFLLSHIRKSELYTSSSSQDPDVIPTDELEEAGDGLQTRCLEGKKATDLRLMAVAVGAVASGGLGKLSIRGNNNSSLGVTDLGLSSIASVCPSLRCLSLWNVQLVSDKGLCKIAKGCQALEKIDFSHCSSITNKALITIAENCPNMTTLTIESCHLIGNDSLKAFASHCLKLESVSIKDCPLISDQGITALLSSSPSTAALTKLKISGLNIGNFALAAVGHYGKSILNLSLCNLRSVSEKGFWAMGAADGLQSLQSLTIISCMGLTDLGLQAIGGCCSNLKVLSLVKCCCVSDNGIMAFFRSASALETLHLEEINRFTLSGTLSVLSSRGSKLRSFTLVKCMGVKDVVVEDPVATAAADDASCRTLRSLSIRNCPGVGSTSLVALGNLCPEIRHIDVSCQHQITDEGILSFLQGHAAGLVKVNLSGCVNLHDEAVIAMITLHGWTIKVLNLAGCRRITDSSLEAVVRSCKQLVELDMSSCAVTDAGIRALSSAHEELGLEILSLSNCPGLSDASVECLVTMGESLAGLNVKCCDSISSSGFDLLLDRLQGCNILF